MWKATFISTLPVVIIFVALYLLSTRMAAESINGVLLLAGTLGAALVTQLVSYLRARDDSRLRLQEKEVDIFREVFGVRLKTHPELAALVTFTTFEVRRWQKNIEGASTPAALLAEFMKHESSMLFLTPEAHKAITNYMDYLRKLAQNSEQDDAKLQELHAAAMGALMADLHPYMLRDDLTRKAVFEPRH